jgi:hypothetical protein
MQSLNSRVSSGRVQSRAASARPTFQRSRVPVIQAKKTADGPTIAIVGITGAVGQEFLTVRCAWVPGGGSSLVISVQHVALD